MQTLERRIAALKQSSFTNTVAVMFIHLVGMGEVDREIQRIACRGQKWQRQPEESEQALKDRAQHGANPNPHGATVFLCH